MCRLFTVTLRKLLSFFAINGHNIMKEGVRVG